VGETKKSGAKKEMTKRVVGIDVGKEQLDVGISNDTRIRSWKNDEAGRAALCEWIVAQKVDLVVVEASGGRRSFYMNYTGDMARWLISGEAGGIVEDSIKVDSAAWLKVDTETDNLFMPTLATQVRDFLIGQPYGVDSHKEGVLGGVHDEKIIATALQLIDLLSPEEYRDQQL